MQIRRIRFGRSDAAGTINGEASVLSWRDEENIAHAITMFATYDYFICFLFSCYASVL